MSSNSNTHVRKSQGLDSLDRPVFFSGWHQPSNAPLFKKCMISVNRLVNRKSDIYPNEWILDSGAFTRLSTCLCGHGLPVNHFRGNPCVKCGCNKFRRRGHLPISRYARLVNRWASCGQLLAAVSQDYMCEPVILLNTGKTVEQHQRLTTYRYKKLLQLCPETYIMPVLQGFDPDEYVRHIRQYDQDLQDGAWVGVGSVCKRNGSPWAIHEVLAAIKEERPDLKLHGFGVKKLALRLSSVCSWLYSADSLASSYAGRYGKRNGNDPYQALKYADDIDKQYPQGVLL